MKSLRSAIEIQQYINDRLHQRKSKGKEPFEIRIGVHTGPVVAGIVGVKKFAYDIWGDTVNIASRMESSDEEGKINISGATYEIVKDKFRCVHRGKVQAKNKGEIDMYFVENERLVKRVRFSIISHYPGSNVSISKGRRQGSEMQIRPPPFPPPQKTVSLIYFFYFSCSPHPKPI